jgi:integrase
MRKGAPYCVDHEGRTLFERLCAGRVGEDRIFKKGNSTVWGKSHQHRPPKEACERAKILPSLDFHSLRHTWTSLSVMAGAPLLVVAQNLGHADTNGRATLRTSRTILCRGHNPAHRAHLWGQRCRS